MLVIYQFLFAKVNNSALILLFYLLFINMFLLNLVLLFILLTLFLHLKIDSEALAHLGDIQQG